MLYHVYFIALDLGPDDEHAVASVPSASTMASDLGPDDFDVVDVVDVVAPCNWSVIASCDQCCFRSRGRSSGLFTGTEPSFVKSMTLVPWSLAVRRRIGTRAALGCGRRRVGPFGSPPALGPWSLAVRREIAAKVARRRNSAPSSSVRPSTACRQ